MVAHFCNPSTEKAEAVGWQFLVLKGKFELQLSATALPYHA